MLEYLKTTLHSLNYVALQFHTEALTALLADDNKFGFIVMDGNGALFGTLQGNTREVLHKFTVDLPKKHGEHWPLFWNVRITERIPVQSWSDVWSVVKEPGNSYVWQ